MRVTPQQLFTQSVEIYRANYSNFMRYVLIHLVFFTALGIAFVSGLQKLFDVETLETLTDAQLWDAIKQATPILITFFAALAVFGIFFGIWIQIGFRRTLRRAVLKEEKIPIEEEMKNARPLIGKVLGASAVLVVWLLVPILISLAFLAFASSFSEWWMIGIAIVLCVAAIFHLVYFGIRYCFTGMQIMFEKKSIKEAFAASRAMVDTRWWDVFTPLVVCGLIIVAPYYILSYIAHFDALYGPIFGFFTLLYYVCVLLPLSLIPGVVLFEQLKSKK